MQTRCQPKSQACRTLFRGHQKDEHKPGLSTVAVPPYLLMDNSPSNQASGFVYAGSGSLAELSYLLYYYLVLKPNSLGVIAYRLVLDLMLRVDLFFQSLQLQEWTCFLKTNDLLAPLLSFYELSRIYRLKNKRTMNGPFCPC